MGCMLRSDKMSFYDVYLQPEAAFEIICQLGEIGCVQFLDMNPNVQPFQRNHVTEVSRCSEMERKLRNIEKAFTDDQLIIPDLDKEPLAMHPNEMVASEAVLEKMQDDIFEMSNNQTNLMKNYLEMCEMYYVLTEIGPLLGDADLGMGTIFRHRKAGGDLFGGSLVVVTGVVRRSKCFHLEIMLWRIARGNIYYRQAANDEVFTDPFTRAKVRKVAFLAVCQGNELATRMQKVFTGFRATTYPCPQTLRERTDMLLKLDIRITDLQQVISKTKYLRCKVLLSVGTQWRTWLIQVKKTKAIYHTMNLFNLDVTKKCFLGQCWIPDSDLKRVQDIFEDCTEKMGSNVPSVILKTDTLETPPTFHRTNKFTNGFQALINAYGTSTYRELNPGLYTVITFPFLFSLMFGDMFHGLIILIFGIWMLKNEAKFLKQRSNNDIWNIFFGGRYIICLLGLFSIYSGFIFNDVAAQTFSISKSYWVNHYSIEDLARSRYLYMDPTEKTRPPYVWGVDPLWAFAKNEIMFKNSIKMKLSIIFGVTHMLFGIVLSLLNHIYFKRTYAIFFQFLPEILFLSCIFLWVVFLIYFKWLNFGPKFSDFHQGTSCAPQILIIFIDMMLWITTKPVEANCDAYMFKTQHSIQIALVIIALLCIPVLLLGSPLYVHNRDNKKKQEAINKLIHLRRYSYDVDKSLENQLQADIDSCKPFSELMIHQAIHTIEFVLSTISQTASYLRLWAVSLAHARLSEMLWTMVFSKLALRDHEGSFGSVKVFVIFAVYAAFTMSILIVMEGMAAFLHTLRLHWVEFMSKFYSGAGYLFQPFCFKAILSSDDKPDVIRRHVTK